MQSCLGIYIEDNIIKYAKVSKDRDNIKIESFGTKIAADQEQAIEQIVQETNSMKTPISVNVSNEYYDYFDYFSLLNKNDLRKSAEIDFEMLCQKKNLRKEEMDKRYIFVLNQEEENRMKAINVSVEKQKIEDRKDMFANHILTAIEPLPIAVTSLVNTGEVEHELIVNMEEITKLTFLHNGQIDVIEETDSSIYEALKEIASKENSFAKAYDILKNTTLSSQDIESNQEGNEYVESITPILYKILTEIKEKISDYGKEINKIYFTGTGITINNIDMYFQDRMNDIVCDVVRPSFLETQSLKVGVKDYLEVNSATALALAGMRTGVGNDLNFAEKSGLNLGKAGLSLGSLTKGGGMPKIKSLKETAHDELDAYERMTIRLLAITLLFIIGYSILTGTLYNNLKDKEETILKKQKEVTTSVDSMNKNINSIASLTSEYQTVTSKLNNQSINNGEVVFGQAEVANFLTRVANVIPVEVKLLSIENTNSRHFVIQCRSIKYQQLGYFKALLEANNILKNVSVSTGVRQEGTVESTLSPKYGDVEEFIVVTIEGDLV